MIENVFKNQSFHSGEFSILNGNKDHIKVSDTLRWTKLVPIHIKYVHLSVVIG